MPNSYNYPYASSSSGGGKKKTAVSTVTKSSRSANLSECAVVGTDALFGAQNTACVFVLFCLVSDSYLKNVRILRGNAGNGYGSVSSLTTWDTGNSYINDSPHNLILTTFNKVENAFINPSTENVCPSAQLTLAHDFTIKLRKGWCAISIDVAFSPSENLGYGATQNFSQLGQMTPGFTMCQKLPRQNLPFVLPNTVTFPIDNSLASIVTPYIEWNEVAA